MLLSTQIYVTSQDDGYDDKNYIQWKTEPNADLKIPIPIFPVEARETKSINSIKLYQFAKLSPVVIPSMSDIFRTPSIGPFKESKTSQMTSQMSETVDTSQEKKCGCHSASFLSGWINFGLPFRGWSRNRNIAAFGAGKNSIYCYDMFWVPLLSNRLVTGQFGRILSLDDVKAFATIIDKKINSKLASISTVNMHQGEFYRDYHGLHVFCYCPTIGVYTVVNETQINNLRTDKNATEDAKIDQALFTQVLFDGLLPLQVQETPVPHDGKNPDRVVIVAKTLAEFFTRMWIENQIYEKMTLSLRQFSYSSTKLDDPFALTEMAWRTISLLLNEVELEYLYPYYEATQKSFRFC